MDDTSLLHKFVHGVQVALWLGMAVVIAIAMPRRERARTLLRHPPSQQEENARGTVERPSTVRASEAHSNRTGRMHGNPPAPSPGTSPGHTRRRTRKTQNRWPRRSQRRWPGCARGSRTSRKIDDYHAERETLRRSEHMLRLVMDTIPQRIFWKDREYRVLGCNRRFLAGRRLQLRGRGRRQERLRAVLARVRAHLSR